MMKKILYLIFLFISLPAQAEIYKIKKTGLFIQVNHLKNNNLQFYIYNSRSLVKYPSIQGIAKLNSGDGEINIDEETGVPYDADEYIYDKNKCFISIRLDVENGKKGSLYTRCPQKNELKNINSPILKFKGIK